MPRAIRPTASTSTDPVTRYAREVVEGRTVAGPIVRDACKRHLKDLVEGPKRGLVWSVDHAQYALDYFPQVLRLSGGVFEGQPFVLQPSQEFIVGSLWGWRTSTGLRRFQTGYVEEGKGNGKSPLAAGIGLLCLISDGEPRAEVYAAATKKDQAMVLFRDAVTMVDHSPLLSRILRKTGRQERCWNLYHATSGSFFRVISNDDGQSGPRPHCGLCDEVHEHKDSYTVEMLEAGFKSRRQPLLFMITNSGSDRTSICWEKHEYARMVCAGLIDDDKFFGYVCALDEKEDPFKNEACWVKANPNIGVTVPLDYLRKQVKQARGMPSKEAFVRRLNFCQWTESTSPLLDLNFWDESEQDFKLSHLRGSDVTVGLDLSNVRDLTAAVFVAFKRKRFWWWPMFFVPEEMVDELEERYRIPYRVWIKQKYVQTIPGKVIDKKVVVSRIARVVDKYELTVTELAYDRWGIETFKAECERKGVGWELVPHGQGFQGMGPAISTLEELLPAGRIVHSVNPCMRMCVANAQAKTDPAGNRKFNKPASRGKIDGIVAGTMAQQRAFLSSDLGDSDDFFKDPVIGR